MASPAQIAANQANAQHSTGPRTAAGQARSAANAVRHGFRSQTIVLPGESLDEYESLLRELTAFYHPDCLTTERHVREMAHAEWRLRRCRALLHEQLKAALAAVSPDVTDPELREALAFETMRSSPLFAYESRLGRQYDRSERALLAFRRLARKCQIQDFHQQALDFINAPLPTRQPEPAPNRTNEPNSPHEDRPRVPQPMRMQDVSAELRHLEAA